MNSTMLRALRLVLLVAVALESAGPSYAQTETVLHSFNGFEGSYPNSLIFDAQGNLYGTTYIGGTYSYGTIFRLTPTSGGWKETVLHNFSGSDGEYPSGKLVLDAAGNLYGTTFGGGLQGSCYYYQTCGTIYRLSHTAEGWTHTVLYSFTGHADGSQPAAGLIADAAGNFYGTTASGGDLKIFGSGGGVVFELSPTATGEWRETALYSFHDGFDGAFPGPILLDGMGNIYGAAGAGGTYNYGEAFKLVPRKGGWQFSTIYQFNGQAEGGIPCCLEWDANGSLFGVNTYGGDHSYFGNIFELSPAADGTWNESVLYQFGGALVQPNSLTLSSTGTLYVTAREGGDVSCFFGFGCGGVLGLLQDSKQTLDFAFTGARQGELPWGAGIVFDSAGNLYGTTSLGGAYDLGVIYEITH